MADTRRLAVLGAGRTASTLARALARLGWPVVAITCATRTSAEAAAAFLDGATIAPSNADAARAGEVILIGVADAAIEPVAREVAGAGYRLDDRVVLHLSGALDASVLDALRGRGAAVGSLHPLQTFPDRIVESDYLAGVSFAVEGDPQAVACARAIVQALRGHVIEIAPGMKSCYHAAASVASNHLTALLDLAIGLLHRAGASTPSDAHDALLPLILTTLSAVDLRGAERALTGPIVRGDDATLASHLAVLEGSEHALYAALARATLEVARRRRLDPAGSQRIEGALAHAPVTVVASLAARDTRGLAERAARARGCDLVEYRLDLLAEPSQVTLADLSFERAIATCRPGPAIDEAAARRLLERSLEAGARYVDVALGLGLADDLPRDRLILSWHGPAAGAKEAARAIAARRPAVGKVVLEACDSRDLLVVAEVAKLLRAGCATVAALASGDAGQASRVLARRLGSDWTYACMEGEPTATGQIPVPDLVGRFRARGVTRGTRIFALAGSPIAASRSPQFMNTMLKELLGDACYVLLPSLVAEPVIELARRLPIDGLSVTMPLKEAVLPLLDERSATAERIGSVNTIVRRGSRLYGDNTDGHGIAAVASRLLELPRAVVLVLGAGGAARAAVHALSERGADVHVWSRTPERAQAAAAALGATWAARPGDVPFNLLVNATPVGMRSAREAPEPASDEEDLPIPAQQLVPGAARAVLDLVYGPFESSLVRAARGRGLRAADGVEVLLEQGAEQLRLFTGHAVSIHRLRETLG